MEADVQEEFQKSYSEGWFGLMVGGELFPAKLSPDRNVGRGSVGLQYIKTKAGALQSYDLSWNTERDQLVRGYPDLGCLKVGPTVGYLRVRPLRQFKKGYVPANIEMYVPNQVNVRKVLPRFTCNPNAKDIVWQVYKREYWHPQEAINLIEDAEGVGYPLSLNFGIYARPDTPNPVILYKNRDVGVFRDGAFELFSHFSELKEQFTRETNVEAKLSG